MKTQIFKFIAKEKPILFAAIVLVVAITFFGAKSLIVAVKGETKKSVPVILQIDNEKKLLTTNFDEPEKILEENNIQLWPEDKVESSLSLDPVLDGGVGQKITIKRAPVFYVNIDGKSIEVRSWESKVSTLIEKSAVTIHGKDIITPEKETLLTPGGEVNVTRVNEEDIAVFSDVDFNTIYKTSGSIPFGQKVTTQEGKKGQIKKTYHVVYRDGVEVNRWLKSTETTIPKQDKIITTGFKVGYINYATIYDDNEASFYLPGYRNRHVLITNLSNGRQITVKIVDVGPTTGGLMDVQENAFEALGVDSSAGHIYNVSVQLLD